MAALGLHRGMQASLVVACGLSCGMWILVPQPGIEPGPPALGVWSLNHWTTREVPDAGDFEMETNGHISELTE